MANQLKARSRQFEAFASAVADNVAWERGAQSRWLCDCIVSADVLAGLVRLAFTASAKSREEFLCWLTEDT